MEDANQEKLVLVQSRIMTGFPGSDARMGLTEDHPSGIISLMGIGN